MKVESLWRRALENWIKLAISQSGPAAALKQKGLVRDAQGQTVLWAVFFSSHLLLDFLKRAVVQRWSNCTGGRFVSLLAARCLRCQYWALTSAFWLRLSARDGQILKFSRTFPTELCLWGEAQWKNRKYWFQECISDGIFWKCHSLICRKKKKRFRLKRTLFWFQANCSDLNWLFSFRLFCFLFNCAKHFEMPSDVI